MAVAKDVAVLVGGNGRRGQYAAVLARAASATELVSASGGCSSGTPMDFLVSEVICVVNGSDYTDEIQQHGETDDALYELH